MSAERRACDPTIPEISRLGERSKFTELGLGGQRRKEDGCTAPAHPAHRFCDDRRLLRPQALLHQRLPTSVSILSYIPSSTLKSNSVHFLLHLWRISLSEISDTTREGARHLTFQENAPLTGRALPFTMDKDSAEQKQIAQALRDALGTLVYSVCYGSVQGA